MKKRHMLPLAVAALLAVPAQAQQLPLPTAQEQAKTVARYFAQSSACKWSNPIIGNAHGALNGFVYRLVLAEQGKAVADTVEPGSLKPEPCDGPVDKAARDAAFMITFEWLTRLAAAGQMNAQEGFAKDMLRLPDGARAAEPVRARMEADILRSLGNDQLQAFYQKIFQETSNEFVLACDSRKDNGKGTRACPPVPPEAVAYIPLAKARVDAIEAMAFRLDRDFAREARGEFGSIPARRPQQPLQLQHRLPREQPGDLSRRAGYRDEARRQHGHAAPPCADRQSRADQRQEEPGRQLCAGRPTAGRAPRTAPHLLRTRLPPVLYRRLGGLNGLSP
jgi:hypothetical protein